MKQGCIWMSAGALGASGVLLAAYGGHQLAARVSDAQLIELWKTAARYQIWHAAALVAIGCVPGRWAKISGALMTTGTVLFSGGMYLAVLSENTRFGILAAIGGVVLSLGWGALSVAGWQVSQQQQKGSM